MTEETTEVDAMIGMKIALAIEATIAVTIIEDMEKPLRYRTFSSIKPFFSLLCMPKTVNCL